VRSYAITLLALSVLGASACTTSRTTHSNARAGSVEPATGPLLVQVRNQNVLDVAVYVLKGTTRFRVGTVSAMSDGVLRLPPSTEVNGSVRLLIDPIGSGEVYVTDALLLARDQQVEVTVGSVLQMSTTSVWSRR
jgi:hypothetical protein